MRILHLSDTQLSGSPYRISSLLSRHSGIESKHFVWQEKILYRQFPIDLSKKNTTLDEIRYLIYEWADVMVYHNRWRRQEVFKALGTAPPIKPSVIQIHSPREGEDFRDEVASGIPIACFAQYHPRQWPECKFIVPNAIDITELVPYARLDRPLPLVSYAPSNTTRTDWNNKSYSTVGPVLKKMKFSKDSKYNCLSDIIHDVPYWEMLERKRRADIGIEEVSTGSYHISGLEYLSLGVPCICHIDELTEKALKDTTGSDTVPFIEATAGSFERVLRKLLRDKDWVERGAQARAWMERYWNPKVLCDHYIKMYEELGPCQNR